MVWVMTKWAYAIRQRGLLEAFKNFLVSSDIKAGQLVGIDKLGNKYFENVEETVLGRDRWVEYGQKNQPKDASNIPPEWHAWIHRMTDIPPSSPDASQYYANKPEFTWKEHRENHTGTDKAYRPYNTAGPKYWTWNPSSNKQ